VSLCHSRPVSSPTATSASQRTSGHGWAKRPSRLRKRITTDTNSYFRHKSTRTPLALRTPFGIEGRTCISADRSRGGSPRILSHSVRVSAALRASRSPIVPAHLLAAGGTWERQSEAMLPTAIATPWRIPQIPSSQVIAPRTATKMATGAFGGMAWPPVWRLWTICRHSADTRPGF
jgi:hypothetical protein